ncbi:MAG TPA: glycosyltransferase family 1 protein [Fibrobacteraceae bacterium]|nr:glycosyltransferase family 1 protein [Fibrobacteraceae bacterium]
MLQRLFIDLRNWRSSGSTGIGQVAHQATLALLRQTPEKEFILLAHPEVLSELSAENVVPIPCAIGMDSHPKTEWLEQVEIPRLIRRYGADAYLSYENRVPLRVSVPCFTWIHDASVFRFPKGHPWRFTALTRFYMALCRIKAKGLFVPSDFAAAECSTFVRIPRERIHVAPLGNSGLPFSGHRRQPVKPTLFCVGATNPRKNLAGLFEAFRLLRERVPNVCLRVTGNPREWDRLLRMGLQVPDQVVFLGHLSDADLAREFLDCTGMVFPSLYEGFGIPLLDAVASHTPVACSDLPPFREILGQEALWFQSDDISSMEQSLFLLATGASPQPRTKEVFNWDRCAQSMVAAMAFRN